MCTDSQATDASVFCHNVKVVDGVNGKVNITETMPKPIDMPDGSTYGYYSVALPNKEKFVPYQYAKHHNGMTDTETTFTRQWIKGKGKRIIRREEYQCYRSTRPPLFVRPSIIKDAVYIDIVSAFPAIYKFLGWRCDYVRGKYWGHGEPMPYELPMAWKAGRSFVVSGARHLQYGRYVRGGKVFVKPYISQMSNPPLVAGVYDVLASIGRFAEYALKASYWNVDGGIMSRAASEIMTPFIQSLGLEARIKYEGKATVLSSGYWSIGGHETLNFKNNKGGYAHAGDFIPVDKNEAEWIYKNFKRISEVNR
jgi:hypothetical protein